MFCVYFMGSIIKACLELRYLLLCRCLKNSHYTNLNVLDKGYSLLAEATLNKRFLHEVEYRFGKILTKALG